MMSLQEYLDELERVHIAYSGGEITQEEYDQMLELLYEVID